ncbi:oxygenase MpaB family protein [Sphingobium agri]|uniref:Oxygenase MpaB family protein n=1 Tax=Sphingobium agri TaxID=2933566 RepID=A0ABT0E1E9_9SPHN|nr:oxygenase MpaB family protein [Sphingobium agri]MCK0533199.1 oxygenase MpaB family protein [Sphingobium agri]
MLLLPHHALRQMVQHNVAKVFGSGGERINLDTPLGDQGLFGQQSMAWRVHQDFTSMMTGGIAALLLQMLHPAALAGIWDHSRFREDRSGRLRRTAQFIAGTTYGATAEAERLIAHVRVVHDRVEGELPDGTHYRASDPQLLRWVHVAEVYCFLTAYRRYRSPIVSLREQNRYYGEMAGLAERLGAAPVPRTGAQVREYLSAMRPQLRSDERTREIVSLLAEPTPGLLNAPFSKVAIDAAIDLLPPWAARMHGFELGPGRHVTRAQLAGMGLLMRWALDGGAASRAERRVSQA